MKGENQIITVDTSILKGTPVFSGTRVPVKFFFDNIEAGETLDEFLFNFPTVKTHQAIQLLEIAKKLLLQQVPDERIQDQVIIIS